MVQTLQIGESQTASIDSRRWWNHTRIGVVSGATYSLVVGGDQHWWDCRTKTGPDGYEAPKLNKYRKWRRVPSARWFALIGTIDRRKEPCVVIGQSCRWTAPVTGELVCFANDAWIMYFNNCGSLTLTVQRLDATQQSSYGDE
jgi:hypothetical protein